MDHVKFGFNFFTIKFLLQYTKKKRSKNSREVGKSESVSVVTKSLRVPITSSFRFSPSELHV